MQLHEMMKMVFVNIWANKTRSFLTALGIIVGAATIILVVAVGKGGEAAVAEQFEQLNATTISIMSARGSGYMTPLDDRDLEHVKEKCPNVEMATLTISGNFGTSYESTSYDDGSLVGVYPEYLDLNNLEVAAGRFISEDDNEDRNRVVVLGYEVALELFGNPSTSVGNFVKINGLNFRVVGVMARLGQSMGRTSIDDSSFIPYQVAENYIIGRNTYPEMSALAVDTDSVDTAIEEITHALRLRHTIYEIRGEDDFMVRDAGSMLEAATDSARTLSVLLTIVASIVLLVGGIGIMNVMFVSVKERTREIGILKAIGARKKDILLQFLGEAVVISLTGGTIGATLGTVMVPVMQYFDMTAVRTTSGVILALAFSVVTGTFFGYYPAHQAANLDPLTALSYE